MLSVEILEDNISEGKGSVMILDCYLFTFSCEMSKHKKENQQPKTGMGNNK